VTGNARRALWPLLVVAIGVTAIGAVVLIAFFTG
jgi:hypothetical protein